MRDIYELKLLGEFENAEQLRPIADAFRKCITSDIGAELFAGELCSRILAAKEGDMSSAYLMSFESGYDQPTHCHTGTRILFIFTTKNASASLGEGAGEMEKIELKDNAFYVLRMPERIYHKFDGDFAALSIHPKDTAIDSKMEDETVFA